MMEQAFGLFVVIVSSGTLYFSATAKHRLGKLEENFATHNDTLVEVQKDIAFLKGRVNL